MTTAPSSPQHPIRLDVSDDLERNRLTVFFRFILVIPHFIWLALWGIAAYLAVIINWFATLFAGTSPQGLHDFIAQYLRYYTQVYGYFLYLADPYPGFMGNTPYPTDLEVDPPAPQNRWITGFRLIIAIPALIVAGVLGYVLQVIWLISWIVCTITGRMPLGLRDISAWILRFTIQTTAYTSILTDRYPSFQLNTEQ
jgi:hypothetical protein